MRSVRKSQFNRMHLHRPEIILEPIFGCFFFAVDEGAGKDLLGAVVEWHQLI